MARMIEYGTGMASTGGLRPSPFTVDVSTHAMGCACGAHGFDGENDVRDPRLFVEIGDASVDDQAGTVAGNGKDIWSEDEIAAYLNRSDTSWVPGPGHTPQTDNVADVINFGFHESLTELENNGYVFEYQGGYYGAQEYFNFAPFEAEQREAARDAMEYWDDLVAVSFQETASGDADINLANLADAPQTQAYAYLPGDTLYGIPEIDAQTVGVLGDVWVSASQASNFQLEVGGYGLNTLTHEIGHAIGLSHPGNYNFGPGFAVNYANGAEYFQDARNYTIMSYWNPRDIGARDFDFNIMTISYGGTPMVHDILAVQNMYGADTTTRTGNTTYGFNSNAGRDALDFTINTAPTTAIWDAGGNDTLDVSGYNTDQIIDLNPGSLSSIGGVTVEEARAELTFEQVNANRAAAGYAPTLLATYLANMAALEANPLLGRMTDNVGIAYGAWIENAVGGGGDDVIVANAVANRINGGAGNDVVSYESATSGVLISLLANSASGGAAGDRLTSIEGLIGGAYDDTLIGNNADNVIGGGSGGRDTLLGNGGIDTVTYFDATGGVQVNLATNVVGGAAAGDRINGFENATGSAFNDTLRGSTLGNELRGMDGNDTLLGLNGNDTLYGDAGNDTLDGGANNDWLDGGAGADMLTGGLGIDVFAFSVADGSTDRVVDFQRGVDDLDLSAIDADTTVLGNDSFTLINGAAFSGSAGELRIAGNMMQGDVNGDGAADFSILFENNAVPLANDIIL
ncbi:M10 family metallopeptidase C-terminal domain-containing protein [Sphingomonas japonica]|uniref:Serralysin n=1 Tax=Sphingomonas japonica TaxID=511662 RepID=A0ABX0TWS4_9SPHN|nr:M10 family metallopeptidase C-terminal domain-containing protein [Sphingomonas japonica]NIJ22770.1 serralysin [Sphingomonas japonica]